VRGKVLICRIGAVGDICMAIPLVKALAQYFEVHWLIRKKHIELIELLCDFSVIPVSVNPGKQRWFRSDLLQSLRRQGYDALIDLSHWREVAWLAHSLAEIPIRAITLDPEQDRRLTGKSAPHIYQAYNTLVDVPEQAHQTAKWQLLLEKSLGVSLQVDWPTPSHRPAATRSVFIQPHSKNRAKQWPIASFTSAVRTIHSSTPLEVCINRGTLSEWPRAWELRRRLRAVGIAAKLSPLPATYGQLKNSLQAADFAIGTDSGPMHMASLLGIPSLVIMGKYPAWEFAPTRRSTALSPPTPGGWARDTAISTVTEAWHAHWQTS
jgi:ADP-heptose:LPS heptosyltransferase